MVLVLVATAKIQPYIFASNRLRENIGASFLVDAATGKWAFDKLDKTVSGEHNLVQNHKSGEWEIVSKDPSALRAEVLYAGGGNVPILFKSATDARTFTRSLSRYVLNHAPRLLFYILHSQSFDLGEGKLFEHLSDLFAQLEREKLAQTRPDPLYGLGVTVMCQSTGLPAVGMTAPINDDATSVYPASAEILAKRNHVSNANKRLNRLLPIEGYDCQYPTDFEHLGGSRDEHSYIAVVHADGDGIGRRLLDIGEFYRHDDRVYIEKVRDFSFQLNRAALNALEATLDALLRTFYDDAQPKERGKIVHRSLDEAETVIAEINLSYDKVTKNLYLPFRPIVYGGDDVTFVCDGRLGLALVTEYQKQFSLQTVNLPIIDKEKNVATVEGGTASAGVAIVKTHYPFMRAYDLADQLARSAKKFRLHIAGKPACLDWHFALSGLFGSLQEIRDREYEARDGQKLYLRPVTLDINETATHRAWPIVEAAIKAFQARGADPKAWAGRRNKQKQLRDVLRDGGHATTAFITNFNAGKPLPVILDNETGKNWAQSGWSSAKWESAESGDEIEETRSGYHDALELVDWFVPLTGGAE